MFVVTHGEGELALAGALGQEPADDRRHAPFGGSARGGEGRQVEPRPAPFRAVGDGEAELGRGSVVCLVLWEHRAGEDAHREPILPVSGGRFLGENAERNEQRKDTQAKRASGG